MHDPRNDDVRASDRRPGPPREPNAAVGIAGQATLRGLHRFSHEAMATIFEVYTLHPDRDYAAQAAGAAFDLVDQLERDLSRFIPNSDISRINALREGEEVRVGVSTFECLAIARHVFDLTDGAFDPSLGTGLRALDLQDDARVKALAGGVRLDLGAVGKGYAVDRAAELLEEWDLGPALVHGGFSSVIALDAPHGEAGWPLTMSEPTEPFRVLERLTVSQTALGASGLRKGDHILDPRTGGPVRGRLAAWAAVERPAAARGNGNTSLRIAAAAVADALTTAFMLMGEDEIEALCQPTPGLQAWILPEEVARDGGGRLVHFGRAGE